MNSKNTTKAQSVKIKSIKLAQELAFGRFKEVIKPLISTGSQGMLHSH
jgi:hypothetical protein